MSLNETNSTPSPNFNDDQICAKAYQIWQEQKDHSPQYYREAAVEALQAEQKITLRLRLWRLTGLNGKTLWDFLQLLIVPLVLAFAGFQLQDYAKARDQKIAADTAQRERAAAADKAYQDILVKYLDQMTDLVKMEDLLNTPFDPITLQKPKVKNAFLIAQIRTVTALQSLDSARQRSVVQFLRTAGLYNPCYRKSECESLGILFIARMSNINLQKADLAGIDLRSTDLRGANLNNATLLEANLENSSLSKVDLDGTDLRYAILRNADLSNANFKNANLRYADLNSADLKDANLQGADINLANLKGIKNGTIKQIKLAKNWETAMYNSVVREQLGLTSRTQPNL
jgi:uncharacterized protein YjbI with pentapeptide repeats